jgi:hypothetical protein
MAEIQQPPQQETKVEGVVTTGVRIAVIAAATADASRVRPKSISTS